MRFSTLALLIALPAAAYAAVTVCRPENTYCDLDYHCCDPYECLASKNQRGGVGPGTSESSLSLADQNVRPAVYSKGVAGPESRTAGRGGGGWIPKKKI